MEAAGGRAAALPLDTSAVGTFAAFARDLTRTSRETWERDRAEILVNNAGTGLHRAIAGTAEEEFEALVNVHLKGVFFLTQALLPLLANGCRIINVSSRLARFSVPGTATYAMMKGGAEVFKRSLAKELGARRITASTVAPGAVGTTSTAVICATTQTSIA